MFGRSQAMLLDGYYYDDWTFVIDTEKLGVGERKTGVPINCYGLRANKVRVDWGDGTQSLLTSSDFSSPSDMQASVHEYAQPGEYTVTLTSKWKKTYIVHADGYPTVTSTSYSGLYYYRKTLVQLTTPLPIIKGSYRASDLSNLSYYSPYNRAYALCYGCENLSYICENFFSKGKYMSIEYTFEQCKSLTSIPANLFANLPYLESTAGCFRYCRSLTSIPTDLLRYNPLLKAVGSRRTYGVSNDGMFECCNILSIPEDIFRYNPLLESVTGCFYWNENLTEIPENIFRYNPNLIYASIVFGMTGITQIPENIIKYNTNLKHINYMFTGCDYLTSIPEHLLDSCTEIVSLEYLFAHCRSLQSIPENIFRYNTKVTSANGTFKYNESITSIPSNLFSNCPSITTFAECFSGCYNLDALPVGLFDNCPNAQNFKECFRLHSTNGGSIYGNYGNKGANRKVTSIPEHMFDNCPNATNFSYCFYGCAALTTIPENLFKQNVEATDFSYCFYQCTDLSGFVLHIPSLNVSNATSFISKNDTVTRTIYVPSNSTTQETFTSIASSLGLAIATE